MTGGDYEPDWGDEADHQAAVEDDLTAAFGHLEGR